jgi:hypothetical protein
VEDAVNAFVISLSVTTTNALSEMLIRHPDENRPLLRFHALAAFVRPAHPDLSSERTQWA